MKMSTFIQTAIDGFWGRTAFKKLPLWVKPNHLTFARIALLPIILGLLLAGIYWLALILFIVASLLDSMDGALARQRNMASDLGAWLDPLADKLLIVLLLIFFLSIYPYQIVIWAVIILEGGAIIAGSIAFWLYGKTQLVMADWWGKTKMVCQVAGILLIILYVFTHSWPVLALSGLLIGASIVLALASVFNHLIKYNRGLKRND